jgi:hypothetical protein
MDMTSTNAPNTIEIEKTSEKAAGPDAAAGCCGGPAPEATAGCCALDAQVKATGGAGCGCSAQPRATKKGCC